MKNKLLFTACYLLVTLSLSIIFLSYSSNSMAFIVGFDNQTDKAVYYKFTNLGDSPVYGIIEPNHQSNLIELGEILSDFAFNYSFILGDIDNGIKLVDDTISYSSEEGHREHLRYLHHNYILNYYWVGTNNDQIMYVLNQGKIIPL